MAIYCCGKSTSAKISAIEDGLRRFKSFHLCGPRGLALREVLEEVIALLMEPHRLLAQLQELLSCLTQILSGHDLVLLSLGACLGFVRDILTCCCNGIVGVGNKGLIGCLCRILCLHSLCLYIFGFSNDGLNH